MHHTAGRGDPASVVNFWKQQGRGYGAQYIMDRDGVIHDTQKEFGYNGTNEILNDPTRKLSNSNVVGMEIIAKDDADVTPQQAQAAAQFIQAQYPSLPVYGHGQVNPGHKEATEGQSAVNAVMALRNQSGTDTTGPPATRTPTPGPAMFAGLNPDARGMKNNNPGNLVANSWTASLPGYKGSDGKFAIFDTPQHGAAALDQNLTSYGSKGINTPLGIASTWAPAGDNNNPNSYGARIATALGVGPNDKIDMTDPGVRNKVAQVIASVENGPGNSPGFRTASTGPPTPGTTLNSPPLAAGGPAAPAAPGQPGQAPGQPGAAQGNWMTKLASSLKPQGQDKGGGGGGGDDQPQPMQLAQAPQAQPVGGQMMIGAGGQNTLGRSVAGQQLAQQGFMMQPSLAANAMGATRPPLPSTLQSTIQPMAPGAATGMPGLPGTTLNSPSQLQMALMTGAMNPYDLYGGGAYGGAQFGST